MRAQVVVLEHTLAEPVEAHGEEVRKLVVHKPRGGDLTAALNHADKGAGDTMAALMSRCAGVPPSTIADLEAEDYVAVMGAVSPFLDGFNKLAG